MKTSPHCNDDLSAARSTLNLTPPPFMHGPFSPIAAAALSSAQPGSLAQPQLPSVCGGHRGDARCRDSPPGLPANDPVVTPKRSLTSSLTSAYLDLFAGEKRLTGRLPALGSTASHGPRTAPRCAPAALPAERWRALGRQSESGLLYFSMQTRARRGVLDAQRISPRQRNSQFSPESLPSNLIRDHAPDLHSCITAGPLQDHSFTPAIRRP
ncbi:hypothetical protein FRAAL5577 [Frankia alni ACN14a]|uniref:Uncharacterized protein n=1 Tax=Frankia alni (strain DSM 45986 / CECT 9034 / ACN14a) TaxID=326424 RepID=Q0REA1_FRAAA|nr:hypothetical protein FRAAL5577 [Frankia alni ACN14a]